MSTEESRLGGVLVKADSHCVRKVCELGGSGIFFGAQVALDGAAAIGAGRKSELNDGIRRLASCQQASKLVDARFDQVFVLKDSVVKLHVIGLRVAAVCMSQQRSDQSNNR